MLTPGRYGMQQCIRRRARQFEGLLSGISMPLWQLQATRPLPAGTHEATASSTAWKPFEAQGTLSTAVVLFSNSYG